MLRYRADGGQRLTGFVKLKQGRTVDAVESVLSGCESTALIKEAYVQ